MADKVLKTRIRMKADTATNWAKATSFVPLKGEVIIYTDNNSKATGMKIGDGSTVVTSLPFLADTSILPANAGEIKTRFRIAQKARAYDTTNSVSQTWYYKICTLPLNNTGNYASALISGRIGGWNSSNLSSVSALVWNRDTPGIALLDIAGSASSMSSVWDTADLVLYVNDASSSTAAATATLYVKCNNYFVFDLDLELYQSSASIVYDGTYITTAPTGTLAAQASTTTRRVEIADGKLYVAGNEMAKKSHTHTATTDTPDKTATAAAQGHTHSVTVSGTAAAQTFTGTAVTSGGPSGTAKVASSSHTHSVTAAGSVGSAAAGTAVTSVEATISGKIMTITTGTGSLSHSHTFTGSAVTSGVPSATTDMPSTSHTHSVTAKGSNAASSVTASGTASATSTTAATVASSSHKHNLTTDTGAQ